MTALWFLTVLNISTPFPPSWIGPLTQAQCIELKEALPASFPGICRQALGMRNCDLPGKNGGYACPLFDEDMPLVGSKP